jgi:hypothetical protein
MLKGTSTLTTSLTVRASAGFFTAALLAITLLAGTARAGTYSFAPCRGYSGSELTYGATSTGWTTFGTQYGSATNSCTNGGGHLRAEMWPGGIDVPTGGAIGWRFATPLNTRMSDFVGSWTGWGRGWDGGALGLLHISGDTFDLGAHEGGTFTSANPISANNINGTSIVEGVGCQAIDICRADGWNYGWQSITDPITVLVDSAAPAAGGIFGTAVSDTRWVGTKRFNYAATDQGGGLRRLKTYVDGAEVNDAAIDDNGGRCVVGSGGVGYGWLFGSPVPCKLSVSTYADTDTAALAGDGPHTIAYAVEDLAGNRTVLYSAVKTIANHPPVNTALPTFPPAGEASFRKPLTGTPVAMGDAGTWTGPNLVMSTIWVRCDTTGAACVDIPGATGLAYTPTNDDVGSTLRYSVTATNPADSVTVRSVPSGVVAQPKSGSELVDKPVNGKDGTNGAAGAAGSSGTGGTNGNGGSNGSSGNTSSLTSATVTHTFLGRIAGESNGVACPSDKATLKFEHVSANQLKLGNGKKTTAQVQLTCTTTGKAITGAKLEIATAVGAKAAVASDVATDGAGHAVLRIARGASRSVTVSYRMYADDPMARAAATLKVVVKSKMSLKANHKVLHNGRAVTLRGRLAGGEIPARGVNLAVQWKDGKRWRPFAQIKTTKKGTFTYAYKFTRTARKVSYQLRVQVAKGQIDYPYVATASKPVKVTVAP